MLGANVAPGPPEVAHATCGADQRVLENVPHQPENLPRLESLSRLRFGADEILVSSIGP